MSLIYWEDEVNYDPEPEELPVYDITAWPARDGEGCCRALWAFCLFLRYIVIHRLSIYGETVFYLDNAIWRSLSILDDYYSCNFILLSYTDK